MLLRCVASGAFPVTEPYGFELTAAREATAAVVRTGNKAVALETTLLLINAVPGTEARAAPVARLDGVVP